MDREENQRFRHTDLVERAPRLVFDLEIESGRTPAETLTDGHRIREAHIGGRRWFVRLSPPTALAAPVANWDARCGRCCGLVGYVLHYPSGRLLLFLLKEKAKRSTRTRGEFRDSEDGPPMCLNPRCDTRQLDASPDLPLREKPDDSYVLLPVLTERA